MSRILKVSQGDYRLQVQTGGNIILDTGEAAGTVTITGNLDVLGTQTIIESVNSYINDNIIQLNYNPNDPYSGDGINSALGYQAGIEIGRGSRDWALLVFSEQVSHYDTIVSDDVVGTFQIKTRNNATNATALSGIQLRTIATDGTADLAFDLGNGTPVMKVVNTTNYEARVLDPDHIPNKKYVNDYVSATGGVANVTLIHYPLSGTYSSSAECTNTTINFIVGLQLKAQISSNGVAVDQLALAGDTISNSGLNNLILTATNNNVEVDAIINLNNQGSDPTAVAGTTKLYTKSSEGAGRTGIYFTNDTDYDNNTYNNDELVSKNRAVLLSILL
jgi:hypothetical protein